MATQQSTMNISMPASMKQWIEQRMAAEGYGTASEYFRALVREDQKKKAREQLDRKLLEALDSGEPIAVTPGFWNERRRQLDQRLKKSRRA